LNPVDDHTAPVGVARAVPPLRTAASGFYLPITGGWLPPNAPWNFWQMGMDPRPASGGAIVTACIKAYAETTATCPGTHWRGLDNGGRIRVGNSALSRILKRPNSYQTFPDFMLNFVWSLYATGNTYVLALQNNRFEVSELHLMNAQSCEPKVADSGELFYTLAGNPIIERRVTEDLLQTVPARFVLHVKLNSSPHNPLVGVPPLTAAALDVAASDMLVQQALSYAQNEGRPSGVITTDEKLSEAQVKEARARWNELTSGANAGGTPILTRGMKWEPSTSSSRDAQIAERLQYSDQRIATVFRIPLSLLSLTTGQIPSSSVEQLLRFWVSTSLGFLLNHVEEGFGGLFNLAGWPDEYVEFDTRALERSNQRDRIEALARGVQGGIYSPNEARAMEDLPAAEAGDEPRVQTQVVPLSFGAEPPPAPAPPAVQPPPGDIPADKAALSAAVLRKAEWYGRRAA
jgi:HK97 family phage portal protein